MQAHAAARVPRGFNRLAWSNLAAQFAEQIALAAAPIIAVLAFGAGAGATGLLHTAATLPFLLFALPAGVLADRMSRRGLMAAAEGLRVLALIAVPVLAFAGLLSLPLLAILGFIGACGTVAYTVAAPALVPSLVPPGVLAAANARIELARTVAFTAGPALAGVLVGWTGGSPAFGVAAALSLIAVALLAGLREPPRVPVAKRNTWRGIRDGIGFVFDHDFLRPIFLTQFIFNSAYFVLMAVYVPHAVNRLGLTAAEIGGTLAAYGAGMIAGALLAGRVIRLLPFGVVVGIGPVFGLSAALVMAATIWLPSMDLAGLSFLLLGFGPIIWVISTTTLRQVVTPPDLLGRVSAVNVLAYGARPVGAAVGALIGGVYGAEAGLVVAAFGFLLQAGIILASPVVRLTRQPAMAVS